MDCCDPPATVELEMTAVEHDLAVRGFVALWHGQRPRPGDLDANPATVDTLQQRGLIVIDTDGRITGVHGLSTTPTPHRIAHAGGDTYTWCAYDAIGIPAALGLDAQTRTACPACGRHLDATFTGGQVAVLADLRLWLPTMQCDNVLNAVCAHANLYCNQEHLMATVPDDATGTILTVADAAQLGRATWQAAAVAVRARWRMADPRITGSETGDFADSGLS